MSERTNAGIGIFTTDTKLEITSWDEWMSDATRIPSAQAKGRLLDELFPDIVERGILTKFESVLKEGVVEILAPAFHQYLLYCEPSTKSRFFNQMQQKVVIAPLLQERTVIGTIVTIEDVTARREREREFAEQLSSEDEQVRVKAVEALTGEKPEASVQPLVMALGDRSWYVRRAAVAGLGKKGSPEAVKALIAALRREHRNLSVLNSALQVLAIMDMDTLSPLLELLHDPDESIRIYACLALGEMGTQLAARGLIQALDDPDRNVRFHAIEALGKIRAGEAVEVLCRIAESEDFYLSFPAVDALMNIGDPEAAIRIVPLLENDLLAGAAADALGRLGTPETIQALAHMLNESRGPVSSIVQAFAALYSRYEKQFGEGSHIADLVRHLIEPTGASNLLLSLEGAGKPDLAAIVMVLGWLEYRNVEEALTRLLGQPEVRREVVESLVRHGKRVTELLIDQLRSQDPETVRAAVVALGRIGDPRSVPFLLPMLKDEALLIPVAAALAKIGNSRAFEPLLHFLSYPDPAGRQAVISALNSIGHPEMSKRVAGFLEDPDPVIRDSAVRIAGYFGYPNCADKLLALCGDPDEGVRSTAVEHIVYLEDERAEQYIAEALANGTTRVRVAAARALSHLDERMIPLFLSAARDADPWVRYFALRSLSRQSLSGLNPELLDRTYQCLVELIRFDPARQVRIAAIETVALVGREKAVPIIASGLEDDNKDVIRAALSALGRIEHPDALRPIMNALTSKDSDLRHDAISALRHRSESESVNALLWSATSSDPMISGAAIAALSQRGGPECIDALLNLTVDNSRRGAAINGLINLGEKAIDRIAKALSHSNPNIRTAAVEVLARMKKPAASERLLLSLEDPDPAVRLAAVRFLGSMGSPLGKKRLADIARSDPDYSVRSAAQGALSSLDFSKSRGWA